MPKSKRNRVVSLTALKKKKFTDSKNRLVEEIRKCADEYKRIYVFRVDNMRNSRLKELRTELRDSRFFFGKNKVMIIGLGRTKTEEYKQNLHKLARIISGQCGIMFSNHEKDEVLNFFDKYKHVDYARTGDIAVETVNLFEGPLEQFPHNIEPYLRQLGMPTSLQKGIVTLMKDFEVCTKGKPLTSEQARILKLLQHQMAEFRVRIEGMWSNNGQIEFFGKKKCIPNSDNDDYENEDDDDDVENDCEEIDSS
ncbi:mRNA turnover protein 4 -like protein [Sarcoptes scabiei]|uniref:Ribosome assembly factor mrt4 n=1 Tax=Sarcoptes scabiei TaxID=52283 RepID=A0A834RA51_SARSC|nr:mRNA turnover protein 4 -like protein [Sarcoptes scabiei]